MTANLWWNGNKEGKAYFVIEEIEVLHGANQSSLLSR